MRAKVVTVMRWYAQDEVNQEHSEQNEVDGMKKGADCLIPQVGWSIYERAAGWWFVMRKIRMVELGWQRRGASWHLSQRRELRMGVIWEDLGALISFYRAMHFSAKRGIAIACRLSVTLVNCDHIGWNSSKIISALVSLGVDVRSLQPQHDGSAPRGTPLNFGPKSLGDLSVRDIRSQIAAEWLQIAQRSQWIAYRKLPSLFLMVPSLTSYDLPFHQNGGSICPNIREWPYLCNGYPIHFMFGSRIGFSGTADRTALFTVWTNPRWRPPPSWKNFKWPYLRNWSSDLLHVWL